MLNIQNHAFVIPLYGDGLDTSTDIRIRNQFCKPALEQLCFPAQSDSVGSYKSRFFLGILFALTAVGVISGDLLDTHSTVVRNGEDEN